MSLVPQQPGPALGVAVAALKMPTLEERLAWAAAQGFTGVELLATGEPWGVHTPGVTKDERERLKGHLGPFSRIAVLAPHQATWDVTLVSPSAAIRRASVSEIWSVFRFVQALGGGVVVVRTVTPPAGVSEERVAAHLAECLSTLDRMAGDHNARVALLNADVLARFSTFRSMGAVPLPHTGVALDLAAARAAGETPAAIDAFLAEFAPRVLHLRVPGLEPPTRLPSCPDAMTCLAFDEAAAPPSPDEIARQREEWARYLG
jgi:sugar phosphate isomerase/epimerase